MVDSLICGVEADLESCLPDFILEDLPFLLLGLDAERGSGAEDALARIALVALLAGETASLVVPVNDGRTL